MVQLWVQRFGYSKVDVCVRLECQALFGRSLKGPEWTWMTAVMSTGERSMDRSLEAIRSRGGHLFI